GDKEVIKMERIIMLGVGNRGVEEVVKDWRRRFGSVRENGNGVRYLVGGNEVKKELKFRRRNGDKVRMWFWLDCVRSSERLKMLIYVLVLLS
ncbi:hypothetical protein, partial [Paenibacillus xylanexedens]|uniref:hypothetical protein n=1 Tax=Paenibacillus xylanexedens TaxID=528191 RepID=UPI001C92F173